MVISTVVNKTEWARMDSRYDLLSVMSESSCLAGVACNGDVPASLAVALEGTTPDLTRFVRMDRISDELTIEGVGGAVALTAGETDTAEGVFGACKG